jgi:hypothetical protein
LKIKKKPQMRRLKKRFNTECAENCAEVHREINKNGLPQITQIKKIITHPQPPLACAIAYAQRGLAEE